MHEARCAICERSLDKGYEPTITDEYTLIFKRSVCRLCGLTLARGFAGIVEMMLQSHGEMRERVISRLIERLNTNGFDTSNLNYAPQRRRIG